MQRPESLLSLRVWRCSFTVLSEQALEHAAELEDGSLTRETLARRVADSVENRFGELNFDNLFLNRTVKTALQFAFRSVTYKLGTAREFAGAAGGQTAELASWARQAYDSEYRESSEAPGRLPRLDQRMSWVFSLLLTTAGKPLRTPRTAATLYFTGTQQNWYVV